MLPFPPQNAQGVVGSAQSPEVIGLDSKFLEKSASSSSINGLNNNVTPLHSAVRPLARKISGDDMQKSPSDISESGKDNLPRIDSFMSDRQNSKVLLRLLRRLVLHHLQPKSQPAWWFLHWSIEQRSHTILNVCLHHGHDVNLGTPRSCLTPLMLAARTDFVEGATRLLSHGASVNTVNKSGLTALHISLSQGHQSMVELLLKHSADPNLGTYNGLRPLSLATSLGSGSATRALLLARADPAALGVLGRNALHTACMEGHTESVTAFLTILTKAMLETLLRSVDSTGSTALHHSCAGGHTEVARLLCLAKANPNARVCAYVFIACN